MLEKLASLLIEGLGILALLGISVAFFFIWLNRKSAKKDEQAYTKHDPGGELRANKWAEKEEDIDPKEALRAYSQRAKKDEES